MGLDNIMKKSKLVSTKIRSFPSDKSLGYFQSSAARTILTVAVLALIFALTNSPVLAQEPIANPSPSPGSAQTLTVPRVAIDYRANADRPLPALNRVGVDMNEQKPLSLREAIAMALSNNKDIEVARDNVKIAEFDLLSVRGAYDPKLTGQSYYERIKTPAASFLSGASGAVETADFTNTTRLEGLTPKFGGNYRLDFSSIRQTSNRFFVSSFMSGSFRGGFETDTGERGLRRFLQNGFSGFNDFTVVQTRPASGSRRSMSQSASARLKS